MAVPGRRNGMVDDEVEGLFEEEGIGFDIVYTDIPPHLQALAQAVHSGDVVVLRNTLDNLSGSIDEPIEDGDTALHLACLYGYEPCVQKGELTWRPRMRNDGALPLHDASAGANNSDSVTRMLETVDAEGDTPLHYAARGEHTDVVDLLLAAEAPPTKTNLYGETPGELSDPGTDVRRILEAATSAV